MSRFVSLPLAVLGLLVFVPGAVLFVCTLRSLTREEDLVAENPVATIPLDQFGRQASTEVNVIIPDSRQWKRIRRDWGDPDFIISAVSSERQLFAYCLADLGMRAEVYQHGKPIPGSAGRKWEISRRSRPPKSTVIIPRSESHKSASEISMRAKRARTSRSFGVGCLGTDDSGIDMLISGRLNDYPKLLQKLHRQRWFVGCVCGAHRPVFQVALEQRETVRVSEFPTQPHDFFARCHQPLSHFRSHNYLGACEVQIVRHRYWPNMPHFAAAQSRNAF